jgi:hypothetical protein
MNEQDKNKLLRTLKQSKRVNKILKADSTLDDERYATMSSYKPRSKVRTEEPKPVRRKFIYKRKREISDF